MSKAIRFQPVNVPCQATELRPQAPACDVFVGPTAVYTYDSAGTLTVTGVPTYVDDMAYVAHRARRSRFEGRRVCGIRL